MNDHFYPLPVEILYSRIQNEWKTQRSIFGIPEALFYSASNHPYLKTTLFHHPLTNPLGVAAGPHTQLSQNIIGAWLCGARYIELKTIQTLDELEVSKPCIDMQDEGYNCEWSQELKIHQSFDEYLNAWIIIHLLQHDLDLTGESGTLFNMSVGYNLEGIMQDNVQWFFAQMADCSEALAQKKELLRPLIPTIDSIQIPTRISDHITLSTMHGCPANEIGEIASYLLKNKGLHTYVKLNPTLLGPEKLREILNKKLHFSTLVPDEAFAHDLKYSDAVELINSLKQTADACSLQFGLKLSNTLESLNTRDVFGDDAPQMYMSGRALHPLTVNLAAKLQDEFGGKLSISFSGGSDAFNISTLLSCGFTTVTMCSDLLKPGGVMRLAQYVEEINKSFVASQADSFHPFILNPHDESSVPSVGLARLKKYASEVLEMKTYRLETIHQPNIKSKRNLTAFDCIAAPCVNACATNQEIPVYLHHTATGNDSKAFETILRTNPFPSVTGMVCDHLCQTQCTRMHYDESLLIREVKRFISENSEMQFIPSNENGKKVAIIGAGPSGLSCAFYLQLAGFKTDLFEAKSAAGGMVHFAIPGFRLTNEALKNDISRIEKLGAKIHYKQTIDKQRFEELQQSHDFIYVAAGAQKSAILFQSEPAIGQLDPLEFLFRAKAGESTGIGKYVLIIGGGNTAMDAARTAWRLSAPDGIVSILYRRTLKDMPADQGEIKAVIEEGISIIELVSPVEPIVEKGIVKGLKCIRMEAKGKGKDGRLRVEAIAGSDFILPCDTLIPATGQATELSFLPDEYAPKEDIHLKAAKSKVFIGGDALRGAATAIKAIGDGRKVAEEIISASGTKTKVQDQPSRFSRDELLIKRTRRAFAPVLNELKPDERRNFKLVSQPLSEESIRKESSRCLQCDELCSICTTVCPNFANRAFQIEPVTYKIEKARHQKEEISIEAGGIFAIRQKEQILNIADFCNECGNCSTFCPSAGSPYKHKPKVHLNRESFDDSPEGYFLDAEFDRILFKTKGITSALSENENTYLFDNEDVVAHLNKGNLRIENMAFKTRSVNMFSTDTAIQMKVIFDALR